jgi:hypothetical protein
MPPQGSRLPAYLSDETPPADVIEDPVKNLGRSKSGANLRRCPQLKPPLLAALAVFRFPPVLDLAVKVADHRLRAARG